MKFISGRIPLWVKLLYTAFFAVLLPVYLHYYGPTNFLYFCDIALLMTFVALWTESPLWASAPLVGITIPQLLWMADFMCGGQLILMTDYMFDSNRPLFLRGLSFFHFWLPFFLLYVVCRLGYDRRAWLTWSALGCTVLTVCYFFMPGPGASTEPNLPVNINYVFGFDDKKEQEIMAPWLWYCGEMVISTFAMWLLPAWILGRFIAAPVVRNAFHHENTKA